MNGSAWAEDSPADAALAEALAVVADPAEETAEWSPADWVPDWAKEAWEPEATEFSATEAPAAFIGQADTGQAGTWPTDPGYVGPGQASTSGAGASEANTAQAFAGHASTEQASTGQATATQTRASQASAKPAASGRLRLAAGLRERLAGVRSGKAAAVITGPGGPAPYERPLPRAVRNAYQAMAHGPLLRAEPVYRDVAGHIGLPWELLAACDWMQCEAKTKHSPVYGEKLGTSNADGTAYWTKSAALEQCGKELVELARMVYGIELTGAEPLSVQDLANTFAAFRWGGLLKLHHTSAMEFPYSVAGLTVQHISMRWPTINEPNAPDKPGSRFRMHFGAVPVLLSLGYPATA